jgi:aspartate kinase
MGYIPGSIIDTIGRGYTDFTASLLAAGLKTFSPSLVASLPAPAHLSALLSVDLPPLPTCIKTFPQQVSEVQIWKEVDGIFTADPRKVLSAQLLQSIHPDEAAELTYYGSEVIHPFTMEQVIRTRVPIRYWTANSGF